MTQFERIKAMSIDEMVEFLEAAGDSPSEKGGEE